MDCPRLFRYKIAELALMREKRSPASSHDHVAQEGIDAG